MGPASGCRSSLLSAILLRTIALLLHIGEVCCRLCAVWAWLSTCTLHMARAQHSVHVWAVVQASWSSQLCAHQVAEALPLVSLPLFVVLNMSLDMNLAEFLATVSGGEVEGRVHKCVAILKKVEVFSPYDLVKLTAEVVERASETNMSSGMWGFVARAIELADDLHLASKPQVAPAADLSRAIATLDPYGGKKEEPKVHVNVATEVDKLKLQGLPQPFWPKPSAVDAVANEAARLTKRGIAEPFVYVDIKTFVPPWAEVPKPAAGDAVATDAAELSEDECDQSKGFHALAAVLQRGMGGPPAKNRRRLDIVRWQAAFDKLALGCAMVPHQLSYTAALAHKDICMKVALQAPLGSKPRRAALGVIYDEVARKAWAERAAAGEHNFDVCRAAQLLDDGLLRQAEVIFDAAAKAPNSAGDGAKAAGKSSGGGSSKGAVQCYRCGGWGHVASDCQKGAAKGKGKGGVVCYNCGKSGHKSPDCTLPKSGVKRNADGSQKAY